MQTYCIIQAPPPVSQPRFALDALVGLEFEYDPAWFEAIRNKYAYLDLPAHSWLIAADAQVIIRALRELRRFEALHHWTGFAIICPLIYIPTNCCKALENERLLPS